MERNENYPIEGLRDLSIRLAWAQLEMYADDIDRIQVIASGDAHTIDDLRMAVKDGVLVIEQPQYGLSLDISHGHWMQLCVRVPKTWEKTLHANTISGPISARGLTGARIVLETVTGSLKAESIDATQISLRTTAGNIHGEHLTSERLTSRSISGNIALDDVTAQNYRFTSVNGNISLRVKSGFERMELRTVTGDASLFTDADALNVSMMSVNGQRIVDGVELTENDTAPLVRATGVSGDLKIIGLRK